jgi:hypothetical protein
MFPPAEGSAYHLHTDFFLALFFDSEDGGGVFLEIVS